MAVDRAAWTRVFLEQQLGDGERQRGRCCWCVPAEFAGQHMETTRPSRVLATAPELDFTAAMEEMASRHCGGGLPMS
jgi:hypothetical protein